MSDSLFRLLDDHYQSMLDSEVYALMRMARQYFNRNFSAPTIYYDLRGTTAGIALPKSNKIRFNQELLSIYGTRFIKETVAHEMSHLIAYQIHGTRIKPHGAEWRTIMIKVFNSDPSVTHSFTTRMHRREVFVYKCLCPKLIEFSRVRHNRARRGVTYKCRLCKSALKYQGKKNGRQYSPRFKADAALQKQLLLI